MFGFRRPLIFLAFANKPPYDHEYLRNLDDELLALEEALIKIGPREQAWTDASVATLDKILDTFRNNRNRIAVFHYAGHANNYQLLLNEYKQADTSPVFAQGLAKFLGQQKGLKLVFLNACATEDHVADLHRAGVPVVIATKQAVKDEVATQFAKEFYKSLVTGSTIRQAFAEAEAAVLASPEWGGEPRALYYGSALSSSPKLQAFPWALYPEQGPDLTWRLPKPRPYRDIGVSLFSAVLLVLLTLYLLGIFDPDPLPEGFNVGVAGFTSLDPNITPSDADTLTGILYDTLAGQEGVWGQSLSETLDSDAPVRVLGPDDLDALRGDTGEALAVQAEQVIAQRNLDILIYGVIERSESGFFVAPFFFISENDERLDYGREIAGPNQFGAPIPLKLPLTSGELNRQNAVLKDRATALGHVILGLFDFYRERHAEAILDFQRALNPAFWSSTAGQEVVYLLQGAGHIRQSNEANPGSPAHQEALTRAEAAFHKAYELNPRYARPYLGLGTVNTEQAKIIPPDGSAIESLDETALHKAESWFRGSIGPVVAPPPTLAYVSVKAHYGLGMIYRLGYEHAAPGAYSWQVSQRYLQSVVTTTSQTPALAWFEGSARGQLCTLTALRYVKTQTATDWPAAEQQCRAAIRILGRIERARPLIPEYQTTLGFVVAQQPGRLSEACAIYQQAIDNAKLFNQSPAWIAKVERAMEDLQCP